MRTVAAAALLALTSLMVAPAAPAAAVAGYDSLYQFESAFLTMNPGDTNTFSVFFANTGTTVWAAGTATQVNLAICAADKVTCNVAGPNAAWNPGTWLSQTAYTTQSKPAVAPGDFSAFSYNVKAPASAAASVYRFNGDLVIASSGTGIHPEGYYQEALIASGAPSGDVTAPSDVAVQVGSFDGGPTNNDVRVLFTAPAMNPTTTYDIQRSPGHCGIAVDSPGWFTVQTLTLSAGAFGAFNDLDKAQGFYCYQVRLKNSAGAFVYSKEVEATVFGSGSSAAPTSSSVVLTRDGGNSGILDAGDEITATFSKAMLVAQGARIRVVDSDCGAPANQSAPPATCSPQTTADIVCGTNASCVLSFDGLTLVVTMTAAPLNVVPGNPTSVQFPADITVVSGITDTTGQVWSISTSADRVFGPQGQ